MRLGLIHNPRSQRNRRARALRLPDGLPYAAPATQPELLAALRGFAADGVGLVAVSGGDGTLREVATMLPQAYGERLPALSLLAAGNANVVAADVGSAGHGQAALERLLAAAAADRYARRTRRPLLRARWPDLALPPVLGFFGGAAVLARATRHANEQVLSRGVTHKASVAVTVASSVWRAAHGVPGWLGAEAMGIAVDDAGRRDGPRFIFLATTLQQLVLGLWPFWDGEGRDAPLHWLDIDSPPPRLWRSLRPLLRGRPNARMLADGYRSGRAARIVLHTEDPMVIDGEIFMPGPGGVVELDAGPVVEFLTP